MKNFSSPLSPRQRGNIERKREREREGGREGGREIDPQSGDFDAVFHILNCCGRVYTGEPRDGKISIQSSPI